MIERFWQKVDKNGPTMPLMDTPCWVWTGAKTGGYGVIRIGGRRGKTEYAHRLSWEEDHGEIPDGLKLDHRCRNRPCVRSEHLRLVTNKQNMENHGGPMVTNKSGVRGVRWHQFGKRHGRWVAAVRHDGVNIHVGRFKTKEEAEVAVVAKRNELHTHNDLDRVAS